MEEKLERDKIRDERNRERTRELRMEAAGKKVLTRSDYILDGLLAFSLSLYFL